MVTESCTKKTSPPLTFLCSLNNNKEEACFLIISSLKKKDPDDRYESGGVSFSLHKNSRTSYIIKGSVSWEGVSQVEKKSLSFNFSPGRGVGILSLSPFLFLSRGNDINNSCDVSWHESQAVSFYLFSCHMSVHIEKFCFLGLTSCLFISFSSFSFSIFLYLSSLVDDWVWDHKCSLHQKPCVTFINWMTEKLHHMLPETQESRLQIIIVLFREQ